MPARRGAADPVSGVSYQLPAFAAAFLGSTCIAPGRFNPWGATVAVYFLVTGITGLVFLGFSSFIQEMFYGGALVIARHLVSTCTRPSGAAVSDRPSPIRSRDVIPRSLERDFVGYGGNPPDARWPGGARLALNFVLNYEEGSEYSIMDKDGVSDAALTELPSAGVPRGDRDLAAESMFEYGSRVGFWRLHRLFKERNLPMTIYACALALERNAPAAQAIKEAAYDHLLPRVAVDRALQARRGDGARAHPDGDRESEAHRGAAPARPLRPERQHAPPGDGGRRLSLRQ